MKNLLILTLLAILLVSCGPASTTVPVSIATETPIPTSTLTLEPTPTFTPEPSATHTQQPTSTTTSTHIPSPTPWYNTCPLDMTLLGVKFTEPYSSKHIGIDVKAPIGTPLRSPGNCKMLQMYIGKDGTQAVHISCKEFPGIEIELGHIDFQLGDSITYFAIPSTYFTNNKPVKNSFGYFPENKSFKPGESLHIYTASTGNSGYPHLHITVWTRPNNEWNPNNDPENFLKCR